jgi:preprotein translocase subunit SecF
MTRVIQFHKAFKFTIVISVAVIVAGLAGLAIMGFNRGVDFQAGLNSSVSFVPPSMKMSFKGEGTMTLEVSTTAAVFVSRAPTGATQSYTFGFAQYRTLKDISEAFKTVPGVSAELLADGSIDSKLLLSASQTDAQLSEQPKALHYAAPSGSAVQVSVEKIRAALSDFGNVAIQRVGAESSPEYMIRIQDSGKASDSSSSIISKLTDDLERAFGADNILVNKSDFVGARASSSLASQALWATLFAFLGILVYCSLRFKPAYALGAVLAIVHDALVMVAFIVLTRMEFNTSSIAAILTIAGFSINDTIVIYDRIREKEKLNPNASFRENMNKGVTETLWRTFITNGTVMLAVTALIIFTTGTMRDFSIAIMVGEISGTYSTIFIASAFVDRWNNNAAKKEAKKQAEAAHIAASARAALIAANPGKAQKQAKR